MIQPSPNSQIKSLPHTEFLKIFRLTISKELFFWNESTLVRENIRNKHESVEKDDNVFLYE